MATEFDLSFEDFDAELTALAEMAGGPGGGRGSDLSARARIAAGNGAVLLLAAMFEEHVRQQVRSAFKAKARMDGGMAGFPNKIASVVWRRSLELLARKPFEDIEANIREADAALGATSAFCLQKDITADVGAALSHNENNMRAGELNRLFNQIGVKGILSELCGRGNVVAFLGCDGPGKANTELETRIDDFFRRRNDVAHAIQLGSSSGPTELLNDIALFREIASSLSLTLNEVTSENASGPVVVAGQVGGRRSRRTTPPPPSPEPSPAPATAPDTAP
jgi:hypothetical protein